MKPTELDASTRGAEILFLMLQKCNTYRDRSSIAHGPSNSNQPTAIFASESSSQAMGERMQKWIGKIFGTPQGTSASWAGKDRVALVLAPIDHGAGRPGLASDIAAYVASGKPLSVLADLTQRAGVGDALGITGYKSAIKDWAELYAALEGATPAVLLRFARATRSTCASKSSPACYRRSEIIRIYPHEYAKSHISKTN